jgi:hypothetical protein
MIGLSEKTVHHHVERILTKLQARNRTHAVAIALQLKLIRLEWVIFPYFKILGGPRISKAYKNE